MLEGKEVLIFMDPLNITLYNNHSVFHILYSDLFEIWFHEKGNASTFLHLTLHLELL